MFATPRTFYQSGGKSRFVFQEFFSSFLDGLDRLIFKVGRPKVNMLRFPLDLHVLLFHRVVYVL